MFDFSLIFPTTVQFKATKIEKIPENYYDAKSWEQGAGIYYHEENNCMYFVSKYSVDTIYSPSEKGLFTIIDDHYESPKIEEHLMLRIVAATHGHTL